MKGQDWTKEELEKLQEHYGKMPNKELQEKYQPNITVKSFWRKASELGITLQKNTTGLKKKMKYCENTMVKYQMKNCRKTTCRAER